MHLHARRLIIDHPDGDMIDVKADLPEHFSASLAQLGFDQSEGDGVIEVFETAVPKDVQKAQAKAHAKQVRKERRGERRGRADGAAATRKPPKSKGPTKGKGSPKPSKPAAAKPAKPIKPAKR
jgi:23S rRNA pseudouridine955/2504/2580 synthase